MFEDKSKYVDVLDTLDLALKEISIKLGDEVALCCEYSGSGDSGDLFDVYIDSKGKIKDLAAFVEMAKEYGPAIEGVEQVVDSIYYLVEHTVPGYEINEGGFGDVKITGYPDENKETTLYFDAFNRTSDVNEKSVQTQNTSLKDLSGKYYDLVEKYKDKKGAVKVYVAYSGSGDSGDMLDITNELTGKPEPSLEALVSAVLDKEHGGYEINSGGEGNFTIKVNFDTGKLIYEGDTKTFIDDVINYKKIDRKPLQDTVDEMMQSLALARQHNPSPFSP